MDYEKLLQAISEIMDEKLQSINNRLYKIEDRLDVPELLQKLTAKN